MKQLGMTVVALVTLAGSGAADPKEDPCSAKALKLGTAKLLTPWQLPANCTVGNDLGGRGFVTSADAFTCAKDAKLGVDFAKTTLVRVTWNMSPAATGLAAFDDGKTITLATRFRSPCPNDPHPMPMTMTSWFQIPSAKATRAFGEASCTFQPACK